MTASTSALPSPGPPRLDREGKTRFWSWRVGWWSVRPEVGLVVGGCEAVALREGVGVVVLAKVAGFLPWATEDTINARSVLSCWPTRVVPESNRVDGGLLRCSNASVEDGKKWKWLAAGCRLDESG